MPADRLRRRQFGLAAIFMVMIAASFPFTWIACQQRESRAQAAAALKIRERGGRVTRNFGNLATVDFDGKPIGNDDLAILSELPVETLFLGGTKVTDDGLEHLARLDYVTWIDLSDTVVTDAGLEHLREMRQLRILRIRGSRITREGFERLKQAIPELETEPQEATKQDVTDPF